MPSLEWSFSLVNRTDQSRSSDAGSTAYPWFWVVIKQRPVSVWVQGWLRPRLPYLNSEHNDSTHITTQPSIQLTLPHLSALHRICILLSYTSALPYLSTHSHTSPFPWVLYFEIKLIPTLKLTTLLQGGIAGVQVTPWSGSVVTSHKTCHQWSPPQTSSSVSRLTFARCHAWEQRSVAGFHQSGPGLWKKQSSIWCAWVRHWDVYFHTAAKDLFLYVCNCVKLWLNCLSALSNSHTYNSIVQ